MYVTVVVVVVVVFIYSKSCANKLQNFSLDRIMMEGTTFNSHDSGGSNFRFSTRFLFGMSPDKPAFKVRVSIVSLNF